MIASNIGGPAEIVKDAETGFLVSPKDAKLVAEKIVQLIGDEKLRRKMGRKARRVVLEKYSLETVSEKYYRLYCSLI